MKLFNTLILFSKNILWNIKALPYNQKDVEMPCYPYKYFEDPITYEQKNYDLTHPWIVTCGGTVNNDSEWRYFNSPYEYEVTN